MSKKVLEDGSAHQSLLPLTFTKSVADLRIGILTFRERWEQYFNDEVGIVTQGYLQPKYGQVNGEKIKANSLPTGLEIIHTWDFFKHSAEAIQYDYDLLTKGKITALINDSNTLIGNDIYIEKGAKVQASILNSETGPIYIGKDAEVMEGCMIRGPFTLGEGAVLKMGAKIYGATTIGPYCKVGGEINNSVIMGYSNKAHDGFIGNSVIGEWCNIGAGTNTSNLKNNYGNVKVWNYLENDFIDSEQQFCGLVMGDHSKCGINTMFNTGTVVGVNANVFDGGFPAKFIPSFSWGSGGEYELDKAIRVAQIVMKRRGIELTEQDKNILTTVFENTKKYRTN